MFMDYAPMQQSIHLSIKAQLDFKIKPAVEILIMHADLSAATVDTA